MRKNVLLGLVIVACGSLALTGCGSSPPEESSDMAAQDSATDDGEAQKLASQESISSPQPQNEIPASIDQEELARYGACLAILSSMNNIINNQPEGADPTFDMIRGVNAHQAAIYQIASVEIIKSVPESSQEKLMEVSNNFLKKNILNQYVSMNQLVAYKKELCKTEDMTKLNASRLMEDYSETYEREQDRIRNIRL